MEDQYMTLLLNIDLSHSMYYLRLKAKLEQGNKALRAAIKGGLNINSIHKL